jgi:glycosyltransferase involved in cell wall biosynthesis
MRARHARRQLLATHNVFITSRYASRMLPPEGRYREFVVNNPVRDELFAIENHPRAPRVLFVGGLRHRKDPITAIRAFAAVLRKVPDATLRIVGPPSNTPFDREVEAFVKAEGLAGRVAILGLIPDPALRDEWSQASVLLLTSIEETAPVALGEACAVGVPQIGTDAGGIPDLIREGRTGFVRPVGDVDALAERLVAVLTDAALRENLARQAKELGRTEFSLDAIAAKTAQAYEVMVREPA